MITIYSTFRTFEIKEYNKIQRDALESWLKLDPRPEILILGNDPGTARVCKEYGVTHIDSVPVTRCGTPYLNAMIEMAEAYAANDIMLLLAGDVMIAQDTIDVARKMKKLTDKFCVCARKKHVEWNKGKKKFSFKKWATWQAGDYYMHTKGLFDGMPAFLIGRHLCEKYMYRMACQANALVDATDRITVLHQSHPHFFRPENKEVDYNLRVYLDNFFHVDKWKDTEWYSVQRCRNIGINFANHVLTEDMQLVDNKDPRRHDWDHNH